MMKGPLLPPVVEREARWAASDPPAGVQDIWRDDEGAVCAWGEFEHGTYSIYLPGHASYAFRDGHQPVRAFPSKGAEGVDLQDLYLRSIAPFYLYTKGYQVLHASAVQKNNGVVVLSGRSGAGKSTLAWGLHQRGFRFWADDAVLWELKAGMPVTYRMPCSVRLLPPARDRLERVLGEEVPSSNNAPFESAAVALVLNLDPACPAPSPAPRIRRLAPVAAVEKLLSHAYCFPISKLDLKQSMLEQYLDLAAKIPVYELVLTHEVDRLETLLDRIEAFIERTL